MSSTTGIFASRSLIPSSLLSTGRKMSCSKHDSVRDVNAPCQRADASQLIFLSPIRARWERGRLTEGSEARTSRFARVTASVRETTRLGMRVASSAREVSSANLASEDV